MEACNFGHKKIVELLLAVPSLDLEAMNIRGQRADEVAASRGINISYVILFFLYDTIFSVKLISHPIKSYYENSLKSQHFFLNQLFVYNP